MAFQTDPAKKYSIYIPSNYTAGTPHKMMLGLHPWNVNRWNAKSWCDTLVNFAESNNLILICPDGGVDGQVDDAIDTAFTTTILDSMEVWYTIDTTKVYVMGFSWGGKTTYTYGLRNTERFGGYMPIGAAINGAGEISTIAANANGEAFYVIHGSLDNPNLRFNPLVGSLNTNNAIVNSRLMSGVGHTIDFANRNAILSDAYQWIDSVNCAQLASASILDFESFKNVNLFPNPVLKGHSINLELAVKSDPNFLITIVDFEGKVVLKRSKVLDVAENNLRLNLKGLNTGNYILLAENKDQKFKASFSISD